MLLYSVSELLGPHGRGSSTYRFTNGKNGHSVNESIKGNVIRREPQGQAPTTMEGAASEFFDRECLQ